jgi:hypothetical protein
MKLYEIFNSKVDLMWQKQGRFDLAPISFEGLPYQIQIEKKPLYDVFVEALKIKSAEVSFYKVDVDNEDKAHSTSNDFKINPAMLYGVIANSVSEKFSEYEAFYFSAERKHSNSEKEYKQKCKIYFFLADKLKKNSNNTTYYENETNLKKEFLVCKKEITPNKHFKSPFFENLLAFSSEQYIKIK